MTDDLPEHPARSGPLPEALPRAPGAAPAKGRGATFNPGNRFRRETREAVDDGWAGDLPDGDVAGSRDGAPEPALPRRKTTVTIHPSRTIITRNTSPDVGFSQSVNPYQGCEHGCIY